MTATARPQKKADIDPNFQKQVRKRKTDAQQEGQKRKQNEQVQVMMPELGDWSGDLFDWEGISKAFERKKANADYVKATSDAQNPGVTGDLVSTTTQIDYLAIMERAFRARHSSSFPRVVAHQIGRKAGHGGSQGVFNRGALEYVNGLIRQSGG